MNIPDGLMRDIQRVYDFLSVTPWAYYGTDLAYELSLSYPRFRVVLDTVRSPEWIAEKGWTIPYVGQGSGLRNVYTVTDATGIEYHFPGSQTRAGEARQVLRRLDSHFSLGLALSAENSVEHRWLELAQPQIHAMVEVANVLGLD